MIDSQLVEVTQLGLTTWKSSAQRRLPQDLTLWFSDPGKNEPVDILRYRVRVSRPTDIERRRKMEYCELENMLNELFPE